jgi:DNA-directed RNA polymerase specialized sigma24 family protein
VLTDTSRTPLSARERATLRRQAWRVSWAEGFTPADQPDLEQDLLVHVLQQLHRFDPDRGSRLAFVETVARRKALDLVKARQCQARGHDREIHPLHHLVLTPEGEYVSYEELASEDALRAQGGGRQQGAEDQLLLRLDLLRAIADLTPAQQRLCHALLACDGDRTEAAKHLHMARSSFHASLRIVRRRLTEAGLHAASPGDATAEGAGQPAPRGRTNRGEHSRLRRFEA